MVMTLDNLNNPFFSFFEQIKTHLQLVFKKSPQQIEKIQEKTYLSQYDYMANSSLEDFQSEYSRVKHKLSNEKKISIYSWMIDLSRIPEEKAKIILDDIDKKDINKLFRDTTLKQTHLNHYLLENYSNHIDFKDETLLRIIVRKRPELVEELLKSQDTKDLIQDPHIATLLINTCLQNNDHQAMTLLIENGMPVSEKAYRFSAVARQKKLESQLEQKPPETQRKRKI